MSIPKRLYALRAALEHAGLDALMVSQPENRRWASGFTGSAGWLIVSKEEALLATDSRYTEQARDQSPDYRVTEIGGPASSWLPPLLREIGGTPKRVGFEPEHMTYGGYGRVVSVIRDAGMELIASDDLIEPLRAVKDAQERDLLLRAIQITDEAFERVTATLEPGVSEREVAWRIDRTFRELGAEGTAFESIVAAGPNGAMAHHRPADDTVREGQPIVIDVGARFDGYNADMTRTIVLGRPDDMFNRIYDIVLTAQETAIATIEAGITGDHADALARNVIEAAGYGQMFGHALGHGVGLAVHEGPRVGRSATDVLRDGMIFTVEPGIYVTGWGGVRIEDVVELRNGRCVTLSAAKKVEGVGTNR
ncbi:MAG: Xaa-Pro peptidase family protein [Chloroflexi bacterium]|nr:Xaa-Pro peptidase family protein [Chloroflexota bacterium]